MQSHSANILAFSQRPLPKFDLVSGEIIAVSETDLGAVHDFAIHKKMARISKETFLLADSGYQGLASLHPKSWIPNKKPKNGMLSAFSRLCNRALATLRVSVENIFAKLMSTDCCLVSGCKRIGMNIRHNASNKSCLKFCLS
jgi:hypothetical protein